MLVLTRSLHTILILLLEDLPLILPPPEGREVLYRILDRASFVCIHEPIPTEPKMCQEETSEIESEPIESQSIDSTPNPSPELKPETLEEEDPLPSKFLQSIEYNLFEDFGNTSRYFYQKRFKS